MYKKVTIAITVINDPEIFFLDEPFSGLDPIIIKEVSNIILNLNANHNKTIIISSHNLNEIEIVANKITIMKNGKDIVSNTLFNLFNDFNIEKSFTISYINKKEKTEIEVKNEKLLFEKLNDLNKNNFHIINISENKLNLHDVYNKIYEGIS